MRPSLTLVILRLMLMPGGRVIGSPLNKSSKSTSSKPLSIDVVNYGAGLAATTLHFQVLKPLEGYWENITESLCAINLSSKEVAITLLKAIIEQRTETFTFPINAGCSQASN
jgi:hypothetical protein